MLLLVGFIIVLGSALGGFMLAGGNPAVLLHASEFVVIGGIGIGIVVIASPASLVKQTISEIKGAFGKGGLTREEVMDLMKLLFEMFNLGRRNGLIALDEHLTEPAKSTIIQNYPSVANDKDRLRFMCDAIRPIVDGKIKPEQLHKVLHDEVHFMEQEAHKPIHIIALMGDSLPGVGIIAAVLGIINTMAAISAGPEAVGQKVAAALTGTLLGILAAYGFINPLNKRIEENVAARMLYYQLMTQAISNYATGLAPITALEIARRSLPADIQPSSDEMEKELKESKK